VEISLQPWHAFKPDGVILFSDILTPLTGMNIPFDITAGKGPVIADPIRTMEVRGVSSHKSHKRGRGGGR
jgi:uroporphyrinogen decarboxylase